MVRVIPALVRSKRDELLFFRGAGISDSLFHDIAENVRIDRESINKYEISRTILERLNRKGEASLRERRELLKRVCEFGDFSSCYPNMMAEARGLVAQIRELVNAKDTVTRITQERDKERQKRIENQEEILTQKKALQEKQEEIKKKLGSLFSMNDPHQRGREFESLLNELFKVCGISIRESFRIYSDDDGKCYEQIDGVVELDGHVYLIEAKWEANALGVEKASRHLSQIFLRGDTRGIIISASGYTAPTVKMFKDALSQKIIVLCDLEEVYRALDSNSDLKDFFRRKIDAALIETNPYFKL